MNFWLNYMYENNDLSLPHDSPTAAVSYNDTSAMGCGSIISPIILQHQLVR